MDTAIRLDDDSALVLLDQAVAENKLSASARQNIRNWMTRPHYSAYHDQILQHVQDGMWKSLDDAFWTVIPFGTGGRRGRMYPIGSNAINDRTIGESAAGLAMYLLEKKPDGQGLSCAVAYDTRHNSRHFAELCARIMATAGFQVLFLDDYRSTPELSFLVRSRNCSCGIMVTASHNPPSDNAVKVYWSTGGQILPPHDKEIIARVMNVEAIEEGPAFEQHVQEGAIEICTADTDRQFLHAVLSQSFPGPRDLKIIYSPLHGVGASAICPVLKAAGFHDVEVFADHATPCGDFPNVPGHVSNPENTAVFESIIERAKQVGADLVLASDPDCDRVGCAAPKELNPAASWETLNGNQIGTLLADFVLEQRKASLTADHYLVKTLVTTEMIRRIGDSYGVQTVGNLLVGFKWIGGAIDEMGPDNFVFAAEESHGYLAGTHVRDKDAAISAMLLAELTANVKANGQSLHEKLDDLYWQHGYHCSRLMTVQMEGSEGMVRMEELMVALREKCPQHIAGLEVARLRDYLSGQCLLADGSTETLVGPQANMVIIDLQQEGNYVAIRPSGTEPKVKMYIFTYVAPELLADLESAREEMSRRLDQLQTALHSIAQVQ
ncbi:MAG: phosphomannomutase [Planctomycetaceae bacterium]|nr:phosphomannomutase [Planctomycetaceae bacterium]MBP61809.1 phosphomannomutase [Planctomycetaceae bacterium]